MLKNLEQSIIQEIIVKAFDNYRSDINFNNKHLVDLLCRLRECKSVFELLRQENDQILEQEHLQINNREPLLTWVVQNELENTNQYYKQSDTFPVDQA